MIKKQDIHLLALSLMLLSACGINHKFTYVITDFGTKADSTVTNTNAINDAIETCSKNGGGTVIIPPGTFITGTLVLLSNVFIPETYVKSIIASRQ